MLLVIEHDEDVFRILISTRFILICGGVQYLVHAIQDRELAYSLDLS